jgi:hypothetical protein
LCLDEATIGSKSKFGRHLIVYGKDKPKSTTSEFKWYEIPILQLVFACEFIQRITLLEQMDLAKTQQPTKKRPTGMEMKMKKETL